jgi:hypothetical protein
MVSQSLCNLKRPGISVNVFYTDFQYRADQTESTNRHPLSLAIYVRVAFTVLNMAFLSCLELVKIYGVTSANQSVYKSEEQTEFRIDAFGF